MKIIAHCAIIFNMIEISEKTLTGYKYIDLFAGIGGFHLALSSLGAECVYANEWDTFAQNVYKENFGISAGSVFHLFSYRM